MEEKKKSLPKLFVILRIIGFLILASGIVLLILGISKEVPDMSADDWFEAESEKSGMIFGGVACLMIGLFMLISGFMPSIQKAFSKATIQTSSEIVSENKGDLKIIADTTADISSEAITKTTKAIKKGMYNTIYCKYCGKKIDDDSLFCKYCGQSQD